MVRHGAENLEVGIQVLSKCHYAGDVAAAVTVVWRGPDCDNILGCKVIFVSFVDQLMRTRDKLKVVDVIELDSVSEGPSRREAILTYLAGHLVSKQPPSTSGRHCPRIDLFWITPYKIAKGAFVWNLLCSRNDSDLIECANLRRKTTVHAKHFAVNYGC